VMADYFIQRALSRRGTYNHHFSADPDAQIYKSTAEEDDVYWGLMWMYRASGSTKYADQLEALLASEVKLTSYEGYAVSFDSMLPLCHVMGMQVWRQIGNADRASRSEELAGKFVQKAMLMQTPPGGVLTPRGFWHSQNSATCYVTLAQCVAVYGYARLLPESGIVRPMKEMVVSQLKYVLGLSELNNKSYLIGFANKYPVRPHHRGSTGGVRKGANRDNEHLLVGGLVGGPGRYDEYDDRRTNWEHAEAGIMGSSTLVLLAALVA
jgi:endoglucanase